MGFTIRLGRDFLQRKNNYLAGTDHERALEFNELWADPQVKAVMAGRGGYGTLRILDKLDYDLIRDNPKILVGFSDITALLIAIHKKCNLVCFHGPVVTTLARCEAESLQAFLETLLGRAPTVLKPDKLEILCPGVARGPLLGGNLATISHLVATPYEIIPDNAVLFLEDVGEAPYRIDRILTQLQQSGRLAKISGLILGSFADGLNGEVLPALDEELIRNRVLELFAGQDIPIWAGFPVGHVPDNHILPIGVEAAMDSASGTLRLNFPAQK